MAEYQQFPQPLTMIIPSVSDIRWDAATLATVAAGVLASVVLLHVGVYLLDPHSIKRYPGPWLAKFTDLWLIRVSYNGHRSEDVHRLHEKHGAFVRLAPNHVSIAIPDALAVVYGHGNGALKSEFYDAFVSIRRGLFNTRDRAEHTRKRKIVSHIFSQKNVLEFEPHLRLHVGELIDQWDRLFGLSLKGKSGVEGEGWEGRDGRLWLDVLPWANYLAFDIIGDLAFGAPFGMITAAKDMAVIPVKNEDGLRSYGQDSKDVEVKEIPAVKILNDRGEFSMTMGVMPPWLRPLARKTPLFSVGSYAVRCLAGIAIHAVGKRLVTPTDRNDLLSKLQSGKDDKGNPLGKEELTAEALTLLIAGSDTTSNSTCAIIYYLAREPRAQEKLQKELDEILDENVATAEQVKNLSYLDACINEGLRLHSTSSIGLPRISPPGGLTIEGHHFPEGTILSVPSYTIHRDPKIWGEDIEEFRPERWFEQDQADIQKTFNPFSVGPRACVGRNLAQLELQIIIGSILRHFHFVLEKPDQTLETREGFLRKPLKCRLGIKRRDLI
ncbi:cytochrome P450 monooxygenase [Cylindrobasidium torrendii FP15055 ss-10]|uniref:Cytochrome P450 monooxygenase n=1 Tax=Cylindrobasidium torrendii FP15055 ss-10 TaxID=1314674 RepID=A0A0D7AY67_9AGAR|nr:cytochrome P450 monooxygenase [Cylindrobasidium torrendii FP15055 ss-10]